MEDGVESAVETSEAALARIQNATFAINDDMELVVTI